MDHQITNQPLLERLAALEHDQWISWTRHFLENQSPENLVRWRRQMGLPYAELTEDEKEGGRIWARQVLECTRGSGGATDLLYEGRFLRLKQKNGWEYVERTKVSGIVAILALTDEGNILFVEQFRPPLGRPVIEIPAGLAGDLAGAENEAFAEAARRELLEETGYQAGEMEYLTEGPTSAGLSTEVISFFRARGLTKVGAGGGDSSENISVYEVSLDEVDSWIEARRAAGSVIDCKVYTALYFALRNWQT